MLKPIDRLLRKTRKTQSCWLWTGCLTAGGYGHIRVGEKLVLTHRLAWNHPNGPVPPGKKVLHKCDTPACINPAHLFIGSQADNMADMATKGRHRSRTRPDSVARGIGHYATKITAADAASIRSRKAAGETQRSIARDMRLSEASVSLVINGKRRFS